MPGERKPQRKRTLAKWLPSSAPSPLIASKHDTADEVWSVLHFRHHHSTTADLSADLLPVPLYHRSSSTCPLVVSLQTSEVECTRDNASSRCATYFHYHCHHQNSYFQCQCCDEIKTTHKLAYCQSCLFSSQLMPNCNWWSLEIWHILITLFRIISFVSLSSIQQQKKNLCHHEQRISQEVRRKKNQNEAFSVSGKAVVVSKWTHLYCLVTLLLLLCASPLPVSAYTNEAEQQQTSNHNGANSFHHRHKTIGQK